MKTLPIRICRKIEKCSIATCWREKLDEFGQFCVGCFENFQLPFFLSKLFSLWILLYKLFDSSSSSLSSSVTVDFVFWVFFIFKKFKFSKVNMILSPVPSPRTYNGQDPESALLWVRCWLWWTYCCGSYINYWNKQQVESWILYLLTFRGFLWIEFVYGV